MLPESSGEITFKNINHYLHPKLFFAAGTDKVQDPESFTGQIAYVNINLGPGSYLVAPKYTDAADKFGYTRGLTI